MGNAKVEGSMVHESIRKLIDEFQEVLPTKSIRVTTPKGHPAPH
jgi:hypothetical protein